MFNKNFYFKLIENENNNFLINIKYNIFNRLKNIIESNHIIEDSIIQLLSEEKLIFIKTLYAIHEDFLYKLLNTEEINKHLLDEESEIIAKTIYECKIFMNNKIVKNISLNEKLFNEEKEKYENDLNYLNNNNIFKENFSLNIKTPLKFFNNLTDIKNSFKKTITNETDDGTIEISGKEKIGKAKVKLKIENNILTIKNIDFAKFFLRIEDMYEEKNFGKIFNKTYTWFSEYQYNKKMIRKKDMKVKSISIHLFFALEIYELFIEMSNYYSLKYYKEIAEVIKEKTWIHKLFEPVKEISINTSNLKNIKYTLKDYQLEFIKSYNTLKDRFSFEGYILSFDQGLGKTLTSIALAECLEKDQIIIVCPNSLRENWSYEIKEYFNKYSDEKVWKDEVYVADHPKYKFNKANCKYIIVNMESISKVIPYLRSNKNNMIIVDESHNFRNVNGKRVAELLNIKNKLNCKDNLLMSGTPIKAVPNEIVPSLMMIDPMFDLEAAKLYNKAFNVNDIETRNIVNARFGIVMYRKTKNEVLALPEKRYENLYLNINDSNRFLNSVVHNECMDKFGVYYQELLDNNDSLRERYLRYIYIYSSATKEQNDYYIKYISGMNSEYNQKEAIFYYHDLDLEFFNSFPNKYILPNITDVEQRKDFEELKSKFIFMKNSAMGKAIGEILPKRRSEMYIALYEENKNQIIEMIENNPRKTVIFSMMLTVVNYIANDLQKNEIKNVKIVGGTSNRMDLIQEFKNSDDTNVLLATSQTLSTGVTLTEANQMFFFGSPFRKTDYEQACDRIYRIGQKSNVTIYNVLLKTEAGNLSTRMNDIMEWSGKMFDNMMDIDNTLQEEVKDLENFIDNISLQEEFKLNNNDNYEINYFMEE